MKLSEFKDPVSGELITFQLTPATAFSDSPFQRPLQKALVNRLHLSVGKGFLIPIIAVEGPEGLEVVDGQHRLEALIDAMGSEVLVPTFVVPQWWKFDPLLLNTEKADNIRDKCEKIYSLYLYRVEDSGKESERRALGPVSPPHILSLAFSYKECGLLSPSLVETLAKKLDSSLVEPLSEAQIIRRSRAASLKEVETEVETLQIRDFNLRKAVISQTTMKLWGRQRILNVPFEEGMEAVLQVIRESDWSHLLKEI